MPSLDLSVTCLAGTFSSVGVNVVGTGAGEEAVAVFSPFMSNYWPIRNKTLASNCVCLGQNSGAQPVEPQPHLRVWTLPLVGRDGLCNISGLSVFICNVMTVLVCGTALLYRVNRKAHEQSLEQCWDTVNAQ